jgi:hypothetical protein
MAARPSASPGPTHQEKISTEDLAAGAAVAVGGTAVAAAPHAERTSTATIMRLNKPQVNFLDDILFLLVYDFYFG